MMTYDEAMIRAADEKLELAEAVHFLALAVEIRLGMEWRRQFNESEWRNMNAYQERLGEHYEAEVAKADAAHDPSGDAVDLTEYAKRIGDAQTETMPLVSPVREQVVGHVEAVTEKLTLPGGERKCMHCNMWIFPSDQEGWRHLLSRERTCYQRNTLAWPAAVDDRG